ncbi:dihydrodipicolinate synthase family protein [Vibrio sp. JC009]|uniref:dihydrodipicolinate synthase family protein n=1 Tax=Vibrio sp. JC009 TaxID=2912314 RepID=UPI0023AEB5CB|nr:dihydrodipicolinate synthase family protein [Vibrio sp. JC009]WED23442.1 dihydrodipicolinate synthase family protein [Vibrio sp. JC009]
MFRMKGVVPPMITPFTKDGDLDIPGLRKLVRYLRDEVDGLFICGSYGAGALMSVEERMQVAEVVVEETEGKIPVVAMVGSTNNRDSIALAQHAERVGVKAVAAVGPYYFKHNSQDLEDFYGDLIDSVDIPVYLYDNPQFQGYEISLDVIERLKAKGLAGIKDATFDILTYARNERVLKDDSFDLALGTEAMWLSARALGCEAFIPGLANAFPEICQKMYKEGMEGDYDKCRETQFTVNEMRDVMYLAKSTQLAIYSMLEIRGIVKCYPRKPFVPATEEEKANIKEALVNLGMI